MHFLCVYSKIALYVFRTDIPFIIRCYLSLCMQLFVHSENVKIVVLKISCHMFGSK